MRDEVFEKVGREFEKAMAELRQRSVADEEELVKMLVAHAVAHYEAFFQRPVDSFIQELRPSQVN